jgi:hypothetical protein
MLYIIKVIIVVLKYLNIKVLSIAILFSIANESYSQKYIPILYEDSKWLISWTQSPCKGECGLIELLVNKDTLIENISYKKLLIFKLTHHGKQDTTYNFSYVGAIRENISERKVYIRFPDNYKDKLLYDFSLMPPHTMPDSPVTPIRDSLIIASVDSILINNQFHIRYLVKSTKNDMTKILPFYIIEGIGSTNGLLQSPGTITANVNLTELKCYYKDGTIIYSKLSNAQSIKLLGTINQSLIKMYNF